MCSPISLWKAACGSPRDLLAAASVPVSVQLKRSALRCVGFIQRVQAERSSVLKLIKFNNWNSFSYLGTGFGRDADRFLFLRRHELAQAQDGPARPTIWMYYDDVLQVRMDDAEATPLLSGGASLEFWTAATPYLAAYDDFIIRPLSADDLYFTTEDSQLSVSPPGVLTNDETSLWHGPHRVAGSPAPPTVP